MVNIKTKKGLRFDQTKKVGDAAFGELYLPPRYASCWIIDGQHRLYGYAQSERATKKTDKTALPVLAYDNLSSTDEAKLFVDINCEQVRVTKSLLNELYSNLRWDSQDYSERVDALCTRVVMSLDTSGLSPFHDRIIVSNKDKTHHRCLTLTSFNDGLKENKFFGREEQPGPLKCSNTNDLDDARAKAVDVLVNYFGQFRDGVAGNWELGDDKGGYLCTNNGVRALLMVLREILGHIFTVYSVELDLLEAEDIEDDIQTLVAPLVEYFADATQQEIEDFRSRQALKGVRQNSLMMMHQINNAIPAFKPLCLTEYLDTVDQQGTDDSRGVIDDIQAKLFDYTIAVLRNHYTDGPEDWWYSGVPEAVRLRCIQVREVEHGEKKPEQYLCLINYRDIAHHTWEKFKPLYSLGDRCAKAKATKWLVDLNKVRNITHHREKWPATKEQTKMVRNIYHKLMLRFDYLNADGQPQ